jgi:S-adenosylmethionine synthetase
MYTLTYSQRISATLSLLSTCIDTLNKQKSLFVLAVARGLLVTVSTVSEDLAQLNIKFDDLIIKSLPNYNLINLYIELRQVYFYTKTEVVVANQTVLCLGHIGLSAMLILTIEKYASDSTAANAVPTPIIIDIKSVISQLLTCICIQHLSTVPDSVVLTLYNRSVQAISRVMILASNRTEMNVKQSCRTINITHYHISTNTISCRLSLSHLLP